ncbi:DUF3164 family protein [Odoribacter splanchnicus]|jgi:translation initiation factor IF-2|uniref:DUF3164 family protein n=1 Tax=Odoribacter splanchnicus TaxID=28118 RepID=UPI000B3AA80F|nr:DUF3164 family protein [Odoribacter splanchnicus]OUO14119.1 DUF3164 domain-containing protein [Odoribacter splanchnicus]DAJ87435.1 MAG TPA: Protein of unknown function (DUF3164) [Caudoviricetes sp.]DAM29378.1 MAG TPA: Protein of unknown function (DUF3164) [Caudoviricetes sp.]
MSNVNELSVEELERLLAEKKKMKKDEEIRKREAYEAIRAEVVHKIRTKVWGVVNNVKGFFDFVQAETGAFKEVMAEYGQLRDPGQMSYKLDWDGFRIWIKCNKVKRFDERADVAALRLIEFLQTWIQRADNGVNNPMYQLAMTLLERNKFGDLDYKSISKLYELENKFNDPEYSEIMQLFKESNVVEGTATNYYFEERDERGVWRKLEPSFNRL